MNSETYFRLCQGNILKKQSRFMSKTMEREITQKFSTSTYVPDETWVPIKLTNDTRREAYIIHERMSYAEIVRKVLKDNTPPSNLAKLIRGECKRVNGWRCEFLD